MHPQRKQRQASERDHRYQSVMRSLVRRYITNEQRTAERQRGVTEDDCNEIKQDISALRFELIEILGSGRPLMPQQFNPMANPYGGQFPGQFPFPMNPMAAPGMMAMSMDGSVPNSAGIMNVMGKRGRKRERRLMKGFDFNFLFMDPSAAASFDEASGADFDKKSIKSAAGNVKSPVTKNRFARLARNLAGKKSASTTSSRTNKWFKLIEATKSKVNPFTRSNESVNSVGLSPTGIEKEEQNQNQNQNPSQETENNLTEKDGNVDKEVVDQDTSPGVVNQEASVDEEISESDLMSSFEFKNSFDASVKRDLFAKRRSTTLFQEEDENESSDSSSSASSDASSSASSARAEEDNEAKLVKKKCEIKEAPRLMVTLPIVPSRSSPFAPSDIDLLLRKSPVRSPVSGPNTVTRRQSETSSTTGLRTSRSPAKKSLSTTTSTSTKTPSSKSNSRSPSKSPSPATLNASVLIGLTQVTKKRNEWI